MHSLAKAVNCIATSVHPEGLVHHTRGRILAAVTCSLSADAPRLFGQKKYVIITIIHYKVQVLTSHDRPPPTRALCRETPTANTASSRATASAAPRPSTTGRVLMPDPRSPSVSFRSMSISRCMMQQKRYAHGDATACSPAEACLGHRQKGIRLTGACIGAAGCLGQRCSCIMPVKTQKACVPQSLPCGSERRALLA